MTIPSPFDFSSLNPSPPPPDEAVNNSSNAGKNSAAEQGVEIPMNWKATPSEPVPVVRCTATSTTTGERCKRWSLRGTTVCVSHGGRLPSVVEHSQAVVESARLRLMGMADDAITVLEELMQPGVADAIRMKAVENVLSRSGIKDAIEIHVEHENSSLVEDITKKLNTMRDRMKDSEPLEVVEEDIIDAEEVDEEPSDTV